MRWRRATWSVGGAGASGRRLQGADQPPAGRARARGATVERTGAHAAGRATRCSSTSPRATTPPRARLAINGTDGEGTAQAHRRPGRRACAHAGRAGRARRPSCRHREPAGRMAARPPSVVINARTGSVVMNQAITLAPCAVAHGNPVGDHQQHAGGQPAQRRCRAARPWSPRSRHHHHAAGGGR